MKRARLIAIILAVACLFSNVSAAGSVLGSTKLNGYSTQIGEGIYYTHNVFYSDQSGVGQQTENYIEYTPNNTVVPFITNGSKLFGTTAISAESKRLEEKGLEIIAGSNADFYSLQTGVPMSNAIVDGKILTKDATGQDAIGILPDGSAFISYFSLNSVLTKEDGSEVNIYNINKYRQPYAAYMMTNDFSDKTQNTTEGIDVVLGSVEGEMKIGTKLTAVVEAVNEESGSAPIPDGKIVITVDKNAPKEFYEPLASLNVGEKVTISFSAEGDKRWNEVSVGMGSVGGRLLIGGEVNPNLGTGAAPRTAIGIRNDGSIVLYSIDGRQTGYSYGVQLKTLAKRMQELGCVEAINLDGGGSTQMIIQHPGYEDSSLVNKPSDGNERKVSTFFFFANTAKRNGKVAKLHLYPKSNYVLTGAKTNLTVRATDEGYYPVAVPGNVNLRVEDGKKSTITNSGVFTAMDNGKVTVYAESGEIETSLDLICLETPTDIVVKNSSSKERVTELKLDPGSKVSLVAEAYGGYNKLIAENDDFKWYADEKIGTVSSNGDFKASENFGASGNITVTAGNKTVNIEVKLTKPDEDDKNAYPSIDINTENGELKVKISSEYGIKTEKSGITIKLDGKPCEFEYNSLTGIATRELPEGVGKITVFASNEYGYTSFKTITATREADFAPFADTAGHWAEDILGYMYSEKIINGDSSDGTLKFNPQKPMTRSEFAVMITNYLGVDTRLYETVELPYSDIDSIPAWAMASFKVLYKEGVLKGRYVSESESCADPLSTISRAEAATIVARVIPNGIFKQELNVPDKGDIPSWAADGIKTLITTGTIKGYEDGELKPLNPLTKAEAAKILYSVM